jgi:hypothetical protein
MSAMQRIWQTKSVEKDFEKAFQNQKVMLLRVGAHFLKNHQVHLKISSHHPTHYLATLPPPTTKDLIPLSLLMKT